MFHDVRVEVTCDHEDCTVYDDVNPPYVYTTLSGEHGHYDCSDRSLSKVLSGMGWWVISEKEHWCDNHSEEEYDEYMEERSATD